MLHRVVTWLSLAALAVPACATNGGRSAVRAPSWARDETRAGTSSPAGPAPPVENLKAHDSRTLPGGLACLIQLQELGISHRNLRSLRGVDTPVRVTGLVGGIRYKPMGRRSLIADCRLVLALHRAAPYLRNLGVSEVHFSGAYSYRRMPSGRLSRHAMGLAIDVHRVVVGDRLLKVSEDYELGLEEDGCRSDAPPLNRMACLLQDWGLFDRVLTPDFDRAHFNHFHLAILSLHRRRHVPRDSPPRALVD